MKQAGNSFSLELLVGRVFEEPDLRGLHEKLNGKTVLITGAGGSIGSELTRQLASFPLKRLVLVDHSEINLYHIVEELKDIPLHCEVTPCLVNICDMASLQSSFSQFDPDCVYHAAAYKHVPLVEANPQAGIINNIQGTLNTLRAARKVGVDNFVLISTDKAVRPTTVMGATKRICELLVSYYAKIDRKNYSSVRFGNVAGSSGSLIPKLRQRIAENRALPITDKRMSRFFMLIPEAVGLVLKASEEAEAGDVYILNMGKPIKIIDLAKKLLALSGKDPSTYPINYVGARPGEKITEELFIDERMNFSPGQKFMALKNGDQNFISFVFNGKRYNGVEEVVVDVVTLTRMKPEMAVELIWKCVNSEIEVYFNQFESAA